MAASCSWVIPRAFRRAAIWPPRALICSILFPPVVIGSAFLGYIVPNRPESHKRGAVKPRTEFLNRALSLLCTRRDPAGNFQDGNPSQAPAPQSLPLRGGGTRSVTERCAAAQRRRRVSALCTHRNPAASLRCGNTSPAELDGEFYGASPLGISACADIPRILQSGAPRQLPSRGASLLRHPALLKGKLCPPVPQADAAVIVPSGRRGFPAAAGPLRRAGAAAWGPPPSCDGSR